jgi:type II secretory ATPase GspE/PulE/Tfp pilus assembly ATPase PilB-like protein
VMDLSGEIKEAIYKGGSPQEIKRKALASGMSTLRASALALLKAGRTTVEEVIANTVGDDV